MIVEKAITEAPVMGIFVVVLSNNKRVASSFLLLSLAFYLHQVLRHNFLLAIDSYVWCTGYGIHEFLASSPTASGQLDL